MSLEPPQSRLSGMDTIKGKQGGQVSPFASFPQHRLPVGAARSEPRTHANALNGRVDQGLTPLLQSRDR
jgi:hypothetical protein